MNTQSWWKQFLGEVVTPEERPITTGIVKVGSNLELCAASDKRRGVMLVTLSAEDYARLKDVEVGYWAQQSKLYSLPKSRRARKRKLKVVPLPPNPSLEPPRVEVTRRALGMRPLE